MTMPTPPTRRTMPFKVFLALLVFALCIALLATVMLHKRAQRFNQLVAVSWGQSDPNGPPALYGAYVWLDGQAPRQRATLSVYIDRPSLLASYQFDDRDLGPVINAEDAVARWGQVRWSAEGLRIGQGPQSLLIPAAELAKHR
jgi:hypothetical protein